MQPSNELVERDLDGSAALIIGHPGHELQVFHWLEVARPCVFVLTDGSGRTGRSRLASTVQILAQTGATKGSLFGPLSDADAYSAILNHDAELFFGMVQQLYRYLIDHKISYVAGDALEGYNPTHDVCRLVIDCSVELTNRARKDRVGNFEFSLTRSPESPAPSLTNQTIRLTLDEQAMERKLKAALDYDELKDEVRSAMLENSVDAFRVECLRPANSAGQGEPFLYEKPFYEQYGEAQVAAGHYGEVIRYREHFRPLTQELWKLLDLT